MKLTRRMFGIASIAIAISGTLSAPASAENKKIGVMIYNVGVDPWMNVGVKAMEENAKKLGYDITVVDGHNDVAQMNAAIEQFVIQGVSAIIVAPADPDSLVGSVLKATDAKIPVVSYSMGISEEAPITSFVGSDEEFIGRLHAEQAVKMLDGKGNVAIMTGILGTAPQIGRGKGEHDALNGAPGIKIVEEQANDWAADKTVALIQDWLSKYPKGELNAVFAHGPELVAAAEYAKAQGRDEVMFFAVDYPEDARRAIKEGTLTATVSQSPALLSKLAVEAADKAIRGEKVESKIIIQNTLITKDNVEQVPADY
ncbi:substrate-binding domain-containing protein [Ensifer sp. T173]|uniref:Substrate-binding domain-containing protein n=1 Tax=Ensifer canadensis TaxID=555315 RepID=A0AAW4FXK8_9HYPH|nr:sugar ABC transporter substrate-binding protein [Ensifer canadensis]MBM3095999.1 substrate-binding domain-containing protein [Ensifer canadensis]UBI79638.1 sugar ABC transporter substrate-binding protein [Ensifer canadensis]